MSQETEKRSRGRTTKLKGDDEGEKENGSYKDANQISPRKR